MFFFLLSIINGDYYFEMTSEKKTTLLVKITYFSNTLLHQYNIKIILLMKRLLI